MAADSSAPKARREPPQYRLTGPVYVNEILYDQAQIDRAGDEGIVIYFSGIPNANMKPMNEAAREMVEKHPLPDISDAYKVAPVGA